MKNMESMEKLFQSESSKAIFKIIWSFYGKPESYQCNVALVITGAIIRTSKGKLHQESSLELGLETLHSRHWFRKPSFH